MKKLLTGVSLLTFAATVTLGASFSQCPPVGADTLGCELLITVTAVDGTGAATAFTVATASPDQGAYDSSEDTLLGVLNSSGATLNSIMLTGSGGLPIFAFDGDGACSSSFIGGTPDCVGTDSTQYGGPGVSFSAISGGFDSGVVNFTPGIANGASAWFSLEEKITASVIGGGVPEPGSLALLGVGLITLVGGTRLRREKK